MDLLELASSSSVTCKHYLQNFLNGTTDVHDQCEAFKNAFNAADCKDDTFVPIDFRERNHSGHDDLYIDDFFENWECCDSIERLYLRNCEETAGEYHSLRLLAIMLVMLVCAIIKACLKRAHVGWLPDACAFILVGAFVPWQYKVGPCVKPCSEAGGSR